MALQARCADLVRRSRPILQKDADERATLILRASQIAAGSASEIEYQLLLAHDLGFITPDDHDRLSADAVEVKRMLSSFMAYLRTPQ